MQRDKKVGLALAILLCSIVGAFFIRDDAPRGNVPELKDPKPLDSKIAQGDKQPYSEPDSRKNSTQRNDRNRSPWEIPEYLNPDADRAKGSGNKKNISRDPADQRPWNSEASSTVVLMPPTDDESPAVPVPDHNKDWTVRQKNGDVIALKSDEPASTGTGSSRSHVVVAGETLSSIAGKYLGTQARYLDIFQANRDQLKSPDGLKIGMKLNIPDRNTETKSNSSSRTTNADRTSSGSGSNKSNRLSSGSATNKITEKSKPTESTTEPTSKKIQFKPSKTGPAIRRSAESDPSPAGKSLSQTPPQDLLEVDDEIMAELEKNTESSSVAKKVASETAPIVPRVAQTDRDERSSTVPEAMLVVDPVAEELVSEKK
ncbi:MAG: LysM peptidoglycan-binding domain-containing protein [Planctomycetia bacterium]|nr:LysM peptidoglycan-binding domain-containing protein [Planctomycetia bacterium]